MASCRLPYSLDEDRAIIRYLIDGGHLRVARGNAIYKTMEEENICPNRSWQSLKNRFRRFIIVDCSRPEYGLTKEEKEDLRVHLSSWMPGQPNAPRVVRNKSQAETDPTGSDSSDTDVSIEAVERPVRNGPPTGAVERHRSASPKQKDFYSLDMEWSDSD